MLLSDATPGTEATVRAIDSGQALRQRLAELGIFEGGTVRVVKNDRGPLVLSVIGGTVAIGRGQAQKIEVSP